MSVDNLIFNNLIDCLNKNYEYIFDILPNSYINIINNILITYNNKKSIDFLNERQRYDYQTIFNRYIDSSLNCIFAKYILNKYGDFIIKTINEQIITDNIDLKKIITNIILNYSYLCLNKNNNDIDYLKKNISIDFFKKLKNVFYIKRINLYLNEFNNTSYNNENMYMYICSNLLYNKYIDLINSELDKTSNYVKYLINLEIVIYSKKINIANYYYSKYIKMCNKNYICLVCNTELKNKSYMIDLNCSCKYHVYCFFKVILINNNCNCNKSINNIIN